MDEATKRRLKICAVCSMSILCIGCIIVIIVIVFLLIDREKYIKRMKRATPLPMLENLGTDTRVNILNMRSVMTSSDVLSSPNSMKYFNPGIWVTQDNSGYVIALRTQELENGVFVSNTWLLNTNHMLRSTTEPQRIAIPVTSECKDDYIGPEDARIMDQTLVYNTSCHNINDNRRVMCTSHVTGVGNQCYATQENIEKNWCSVEGRPGMYLYTTSPPRLVILPNITFSNTGTVFTQGSINNGTCLLDMSQTFGLPRGFYFTISHSRNILKAYRNVGIVWYIPDDPNVVPTCFGYTDYFHFGSEYQIEYVSSICRNVDDPNGIIVGVGLQDTDFRICCVDLDEFWMQMHVISAWTLPPHKHPLQLNNTVRCINLDRSPDRMAWIREHLNVNGLSVSRFPAYDGRAISRGEVDISHLGVVASKEDRRFKPSGRCGASGHELYADSWGQVGCTCSHLEVWREIMTLDDAWYIICEDDAKLLYEVTDRNVSMGQWLSTLIEDAPPDADFLYIGHQCSVNYTHNDPVFIKLEEKTTFCLHFYAITPRGASMLTSAAQMYTVGVVDIWLHLQQHKIINSYLVNEHALERWGKLRRIVKTTHMNSVDITRGSGIVCQSTDVFETTING